MPTWVVPLSNLTIIFDQVVHSSLQALYKAGEGKLGTDESGFFNIMTGRTYAHLRVVFDEYIKQNSSSIEEAIKGEFGGVAQTALLEFGKSLTRIVFLLIVAFWLGQQGHRMGRILGPLFSTRTDVLLPDHGKSWSSGCQNYRNLRGALAALSNFQNDQL